MDNIFAALLSFFACIFIGFMWFEGFEGNL
jgi:hypothetical protein